MEVQVRVFVDPLKVREVMLGEPVLLKYSELVYESNASMVMHSPNKSIYLLMTSFTYFNLVGSGMWIACMHTLACTFTATFTPFVQIVINAS